jgi:NDP-sugar pyrophosphorylase family protein
MKAMILAAGLGTRLHPLTNDRPKALVTLAGRTLLQITLERLRSFGVNEVIVNTHHYADMILEYLAANQNFGIRIEVSREEVLLDTGGGLKNAALFFLDSTGRSQDKADEPFILHNVDVISTIDLGNMVRFHQQQAALATLAVQDRETSRYLLFDSQGQLQGRSSTRTAAEGEPLAFSGIHIVSPRIFTKMTEDGAFSVIDSYLRLANQGERILAYRSDNSYWRDLGRPQSLIEAAQDIEAGKLAMPQQAVNCHL